MAVSGGVDSVVLLDLLAKEKNLRLMVAHFDHGIRDDSSEDRKFVESLAKKRELSFVFAEGKLGPNASEALAREKRYEFLQKTRIANGASAIVTAHHQDDVIETAIINLLRGTNRRGLASLKDTATVKRPLLNNPKQQIKSYAVKNNLAWREDPTNANTKYLRNYVRHELVPKLGPSGRQQLLAIINKASQQNSEIDTVLANLVGAGLDRAVYRSYDASLGLELIAAWLRANDITGYDRKTLARLDTAIRSARNGTAHNIIGDQMLVISRNGLALERLER